MTYPPANPDVLIHRERHDEAERLGVHPSQIDCPRRDCSWRGNHCSGEETYTVPADAHPDPEPTAEEWAFAREHNMHTPKDGPNEPDCRCSACTEVAWVSARYRTRLMERAVGVCCEGADAHDDAAGDLAADNPTAAAKYRSMAHAARMCADRIRTTLSAGDVETLEGDHAE